MMVGVFVCICWTCLPYKLTKQESNKTVFPVLTREKIANIFGALLTLLQAKQECRPIKLYEHVDISPRSQCCLDTYIAYHG
jgi:hypothetical protein